MRGPGTFVIGFEKSLEPVTAVAVIPACNAGIVLASSPKNALPIGASSALLNILAMSSSDNILDLAGKSAYIEIKSKIPAVPFLRDLYVRKFGSAAMRSEKSTRMVSTRSCARKPPASFGKLTSPSSIAFLLAAGKSSRAVFNISGVKITFLIENGSGASTISS